MTTATKPIPRFPLDGLRKHKLLTADLVKRLPALGSTDGTGDPFENVAEVKLFCPFGRMTFYVTEFDGEDQLFGYMVSPLGEDCDEWGYSSLSELANTTVYGGVPAIERDKGWPPRTVAKALGN